MHTQQECTCFDDWKVSDVIFNHKSDSCLHAYFQYFKILLQVSGNELIRRANKRSEFGVTPATFALETQKIECG